MRYAFLGLILAAASALAIEESVITDTAHPRAKLDPLSGIQGMSKDIRVYVRQDGLAYTGLTGSVVTMYYATNLTAATVGTATNISIDTNTWSALVRTAALPPGSFRYALSITSSGLTNDLGTGLLTVEASTFAGGWAPLPGQTIDWSTLIWTGSNQPMRASGGTMSGDLNMVTLVGPPGSVNIGLGRGQVTNLTGLASPGGYQQLYWSDDVFRIMPYHSAYGSGSGPALEVNSSGMTISTNVFLPLLPTSTNGFTQSGTIWNSNNVLSVWTAP